MLGMDSANEASYIRVAVTAHEGTQASVCYVLGGKL